MLFLFRRMLQIRMRVTINLAPFIHCVNSFTRDEWPPAKKTEIGEGGRLRQPTNCNVYLGFQASPSARVLWRQSSGSTIGQAQFVHTNGTKKAFWKIEDQFPCRI